MSSHEIAHLLHQYGVGLVFAGVIAAGAAGACPGTSAGFVLGR